jgi:hypothetical protein
MWGRDRGGVATGPSSPLGIELLGGLQGCFKVAGKLTLGCVGGLAGIRSMKERVMSVRIRRFIVAVAAAAAVAVPAALAFAVGQNTPPPNATSKSATCVEVRGRSVDPAPAA